MFFLTNSRSNFLILSTIISSWKNPNISLVTSGFHSPDGNMSAYKVEVYSKTATLTGFMWNVSTDCLLGYAGEKITGGVYIKRGSAKLTSFGVGMINSGGSWHAGVAQLLWNNDIPTLLSHNGNFTKFKITQATKDWYKIVGTVASSYAGSTATFMLLYGTCSVPASYSYGYTYYWNPSILYGDWDNIPSYVNTHTDVANYTKGLKSDILSFDAAEPIKIKEKLYGYDHRTHSGKALHYARNTRYTISIPVDNISATDKDTLNTYWQNDIRLSLQDEFSGQELMCKLVNKYSPIDKPGETDQASYRGVLELETYDGF